MHTTSGERRFVDLVAGEQRCSVGRELGDFVVAKGNAAPAYQLAVVADDHAMGITQVLRGDDLLPSAFRQLELYDFFGWKPPEFVHVPLVVGPDGRRLAKRHGDTRLSMLREAGVPPERLVGLLAWSCGLRPTPAPAAAADLVADFSLARLPRQPLVFAPEMLDELLRPTAGR
jgi:glutamyl-tRNA synthetase